MNLKNKKLLVILLVILLLSCSKSQYCNVNGNWILYKEVNNQTRKNFIYPEDSCFYYFITDNKARIFKHTNNSDSFMFERKVDCNYVFFQTKDSFQYGYLWKFVMFKRKN